MTLANQITGWALRYEGSTRAAGLMRIGLVLLIWGRFAGSMLPKHDLHLPWILFGMTFFVATGLMLVGLWSRLSSLLVSGVVFTNYFYFGHYLGNAYWAGHHVYLLAIACFFLALTPCGKSYSLDRWRALHRAERRGQPAPKEWGNLWGMRLIAFQLSMVYFWAAFSKANPAFLSGDRLQQLIYANFPGPDYSQFFLFEPLTMVAAIGVVILQLALAFGLHFPWGRKYLMPLGIVMHLAFYVLLYAFTFSLTMILLYLAFIPAGTVHRVLNQMQGVSMPEARPDNPLLSKSRFMEAGVQPAAPTKRKAAPLAGRTALR
ncbi:MAG TPA: HTTM domain-containing protein [Rhodothermales bacterium]|nr:HTTM domain-containing protein [Rhodothermales bacterium]